MSHPENSSHPLVEHFAAVLDAAPDCPEELAQSICRAQFIALDGARVALSLSISSWAKKAKVSQPFLSMAAAGERVPSPPLIERLRQGLGLPRKVSSDARKLAAVAVIGLLCDHVQTLRHTSAFYFWLPLTGLAALMIRAQTRRQRPPEAEQWKRDVRSQFIEPTGTAQRLLEEAVRLGTIAQRVARSYDVAPETVPVLADVVAFLQAVLQAREAARGKSEVESKKLFASQPDMIRGVFDRDLTAPGHHPLMDMAGSNMAAVVKSLNPIPLVEAQCSRVSVGGRLAP